MSMEDKNLSMEQKRTLRNQSSNAIRAKQTMDALGWEFDATKNRKEQIKGMKWKKGNSFLLSWKVLKHKPQKAEAIFDKISGPRNKNYSGGSVYFKDFKNVLHEILANMEWKGPAS